MLCLNLNFPVWFQMPGRGQDARPPGTPTAPHPRAEAARPPGHQRSSTAQRRPERGDASAVRREGLTGAVTNSFIMFYEKERCKIASPPPCSPLWANWACHPPLIKINERDCRLPFMSHVCHMSYVRVSKFSNFKFFKISKLKNIY